MLIVIRSEGPQPHAIDLSFPKRIFVAVSEAVQKCSYQCSITLLRVSADFCNPSSKFPDHQDEVAL
jgi:hypothetical protein